MEGTAFRGGKLGLWAVWAALGVAGCGGRTSFDGSPAPAQPAAGAGGPGAPIACSSPTAIGAERTWQTDTAMQYGVFGRGVLAFSPDGAQIVTPSDEYVYVGYSEYASANGALATSRRVGLLGRDRAWRRDLLRDPNDPSTLSALFDRGSPEPRFSLAAHPRPTALSADGGSITSLSCSGASPMLRHTRVEPFDQTELYLSNTSCAGLNSFTWTFVPLALTPSGETAAFGFDDSGLLWLADFERKTVRSARVYPPQSGSSSYPAHFLVNVEFSPSGRSIAVAAANEPLRVLSYPELDPLLPDIPVTLGQGFTNCYCSWRLYAPIAWSADETLLATADASGVVVRRACDGAPLATLPVPAGTVTAYLAFAPDGHALAALSLDNTPIGSTLSYYRLSY